MFKVKEKLKGLKQHIKSWSKNTFGEVDCRIKAKVDQMEELDMKLIEGY